MPSQRPFERHGVATGRKELVSQGAPGEVRADFCQTIPRGRQIPDTLRFNE
jgi:hypothetical protein